jgi:glutathione S-transferase
MVLLLAKHLDVPLDVKNLDLAKGEQLKPEFVAINPQHTVPTLVDDGFVLTESRAMLMYLQNKYGKDESLYPKDPKKRALVDMRLFFDISTMYLRFGEAHYPVMFQKVKPDPEKLAKIDEALGYVELFLKDGYIAGSELTIADFSLAATLSTIEACDYDFSKFTKVTEYLAKLKSTLKGWDELNQTGADMFGQWYKGALAEALA